MEAKPRLQPPFTKRWLAPAGCMCRTLLKVCKWLTSSKCVTEVNVNVAQGLYIHWSTVKHSAEKIQAASVKLVEGSRRVCSRRVWNIH